MPVTVSVNAVSAMWKVVAPPHHHRFQIRPGAIDKQITAIYAEQVCTFATLWKEIRGEHVWFAGLFSTRTLQMSIDLQQAATTE